VWSFFTFWPSKIYINPTGVVSSLFSQWCRLSSGQRHHTAAPCHASFSWSQDELAASASSSSNASSRRLSPLEPKLKHWIHTTTTGHPLWTVRLPNFIAVKCHLNFDHSLYNSTTSPFCLPNQSTVLSELHLPPSFSFTAIPRHRPSVQRYSRCRTSRPSFASRTTYRHVNSHKRIIWNYAASHGVINYCHIFLRLIYSVSLLAWVKRVTLYE
jgi:hypothetical protein